MKLGGLPAGKEAEKFKFPPEVTKGQQAVPANKLGTVVDLKVTFFPDAHEDNIAYYKNLHMFQTKSWASFGFKPKSKDLKTVIDELHQLEYLIQVADTEYLTPSIVLDGRKVRVGLEGGKIDPFEDQYSD